jgi:8-oxo-dGTP diphosphatase
MIRTGRTIVAAYLILKQKDQVCLLLRQNTGFCDGLYGLISGHVEDGESATTAMIREAEEEAGIKISLTQLEVVHIIHRKTPERLAMDVFFECSSWMGSIQNREPHKCEKLEFFPILALPPTTIDYVAKVIQHVLDGQFYSEMGWSEK